MIFINNGLDPINKINFRNYSVILSVLPLIKNKLNLSWIDQMNQKSTIFAMSGAALAILMMVFVLFFNYARNNADKNLSGEIPEDLDLNFSELPETDIPLIDDDATR